MTVPVSAAKFESAALRYQWINYVNEYPALPPILSTETASDEVFKTVTARFSGANSAPNKSVVKFAPAQYRIARFDGKVRFMELPHPVPYFFLVQSLVKHWDKVGRLISSPNSRIRPKSYPRDNRIVVFGDSYNNNEELPSFSLNNGSPILEHSLVRGTVVQLDISNFFPSVYTHAIDWAVSGQRSTAHGAGSEIDKAFQGVRTKRTDGLSIGPVTSNIAAEMMLHKLDNRLADLTYPALYSRAIDDLTILIPSSEDPDALSNLVSKELSRVGLALNHAKTKIAPLKTWHSQHIAKNLVQVTDLIADYPSKKRLRQAFSSLYALADEQPSTSLVKYGWKQIRSIVNSNAKNNRRESLSYFLVLSWEMAAHYPHMVPSVVAESIFHEQNLDGRIPRQFVIDFLKQQLPKGLTDITTWLLFYCCHQKIDPAPALESIGFFEPNNASELRSTSIDAFVGSLLLTFQDERINQQLVRIFNDPNYFSDNRTLDWSDFWPIRYSLFETGDLPSKELENEERRAFTALKNDGFSLLRNPSTDFRALISQFRTL